PYHLQVLYKQFLPFLKPEIQLVLSYQVFYSKMETGSSELIKEFLITYAGEFLYFGGIPITYLIPLAIYLALFDKICDCR
ncbi:MAG: hypothetical protein ACRENO_10910, partial [Thermodesulfobacteriota bacterium]